MALDLVIGHKGEDHISATDVARLLKDVIGDSAYVIKKPTVKTIINGQQITIRISGGSYSLMGRYIYDASLSTLSDTGVSTAGKYRRDAINIKFTRVNNIESVEYEIKTGTEADTEATAYPPAEYVFDPEVSSTSGMFIGTLLITYDSVTFEPKVEGNSFNPKSLDVSTERYRLNLLDLCVPGGIISPGNNPIRSIYRKFLVGLSKNHFVNLGLEAGTVNGTPTINICHRFGFIDTMGRELHKYQEATVNLTGETAPDYLYVIGAKIVFDLDVYLKSLVSDSFDPIESITYDLLYYDKYKRLTFDRDRPTVKIDGMKIPLGEAGITYSKTGTKFTGKATIRVPIYCFYVDNWNNTPSNIPISEIFRMGGYSDTLYDKEKFGLRESIGVYTLTSTSNWISGIKEVLGAFIDGHPTPVEVITTYKNNTKLSIPALTSGKTCYLAYKKVTNPADSTEEGPVRTRTFTNIN